MDKPKTESWIKLSCADCAAEGYLTQRCAKGGILALAVTWWFQNFKLIQNDVLLISVSFLV